MTLYVNFLLTEIIKDGGANQRDIINLFRGHDTYRRNFGDEIAYGKHKLNI